MKRHFVCYPCADPVRGNECALRWMTCGYEPLVMTYFEEWRDKLPGPVPFYRTPKPKPWPGYYQVINDIATEAFRLGADLVTCIGDDMAPPVCGADAHSEIYFKRFPDGLGVMQCTGDRQGVDSSGRAASERICGSPTFGKGWATRAFGGHGPFGAFGFKSYYADELLHDVAEKLGLLYQEPLLSIDHEHWSFGRSEQEWWHKEANANWAGDNKLFAELKANGFPGSELL